MAPSSRQLPWLRHRAAAAAGLAAILSSTLAGAQPTTPPLYPEPPPPYAPPAPPPLTTGGLTPPPTTPQSPGETQTMYQLDRAEREDAGRGLEFVWLNVEAGYEYISLQGFEDNSLVDGELVED